jgi:hypothetical protein
VRRCVFCDRSPAPRFALTVQNGDQHKTSSWRREVLPVCPRCRRVRAELRRQFPDAAIPHFTTIARWLREMPPNEGRAAVFRWWLLLERAGEIVYERMKTERMSPLDLAKIASKAADIRLALAQSPR